MTLVQVHPSFLRGQRRDLALLRSTRCQFVDKMADGDEIHWIHARFAFLRVFVDLRDKTQ